MQYSVISYVPGAGIGDVGIVVIQVVGCKLTTSLDVPHGCVQGDAKWNAVVDPVVASVLSAMDPSSENYDPSLKS
jgi:hypothetical protein